MSPQAAALALFCATLGAASPARALEAQARELLLKSIRPSQLKAVESAVGGLDALPFLTAEIELTPEARSVVGEVRLDWPNRTGRQLDHVIVRLSSNAANGEAPFVEWTGVKASVKGGAPVAVAARPISEHLVRLELPSPLAPGERVVLSGALLGKLAVVEVGSEDPTTASLRALSGGASASADGSQYGTFACGEGICTLTGFLPEIPAFLDGEFDTIEGSGIGDATYSEPVNAVMSVLAPTGVTLSATGVEVGREPTRAGLRRTTFVIAAARELGIVASADFVVTKLKVGDVEIRSLAKREDCEGGRRALDAAKGALKTFEKAFGPYPWTHLDIAESALTGGAGGVELPALALGATGFYQESNPTLALVAAVTGGDMTQDMLGFITRHEVAHQWWHAQVGSHSQLHPYIDEPLAQWSALLATKRDAGPEAAAKARKLQVALNFQAHSLLGFKDGKVARDAREFAAPVEYAGLVYGKAPLFYEAAAKQYGEEAVLSGLRALVKAKRFRRATPDDLENALAASCGPGLHALWNHWFEEAHGDKDLGPLEVGGVTLDSLPTGVFGGSGGGGMQLDPKTLHDAMEQLNDFLQDFGGE